MLPESWATFIGFLAGRQAYILAQIKDSALAEWSDSYLSSTGMQMPKLGEGYLIVAPDTNKWASSSSVAFKATRGELAAANGYSALPLEVEVKERRNGQLIFSSDKVMWDLFDSGFVLGTQQPTQDIRGYVPYELRPRFDEGLRIAGSRGS